MADDWWGEIASVNSARTKSGSPSPVDWWGEIAPKLQPKPGEMVDQSTSGAANIGDVAVASLANDPQAQIRYFSRQRGIPEDRYGVVSGQIVYRGDDGKMHAEIPRGTMGGYVRQAAAGLGPSIPAVSGAAAGILSSPMLLAGPLGLVGSIALTGGAAGLGQTAREALANLLMDQKIDPWRIATESGQAAIGQGVGAGMTAWAQRNLVPDIARMSAPAVENLRNNASGFGVQLTPAEETGLSSLRAQQKYLGNVTASQDIMQDFYEKRSDQIKNAIGSFLSRISPEDSSEMAGRMARDAARSAISGERKKLQDLASPLYMEAFQSNPSVASKELDRIVETPAGRRALNSARVKMQNDMSPLGVPDSELTALARDAGIEGGDIPKGGVASGLKLRTWDYVKRSIDDMIGEAQQAGRRDDVGILSRLKGRLVNQLDSLDVTGRAGPNSTVPEGGKYKQARRLYAGEMPNIRALEEGLLGRIADTSEIDTASIARRIFGAGSGRQQIETVKSYLRQSNPDAWQAVKRGYLQDVFERAQNETVQGEANVAGNFRKAVMGNFQQQERLRAALDPNEFSTLSDLADVLKAASSVKPIGSDTEFNRLITEAEKSQARTFFAKVVRNINPSTALESFDEWLTNKNVRANAEKLANIITQPGAASTLRQLRMLSPNSVKFRVAFGHLLSMGVANKAGDVLFAEPDRVPSE